MKNANFSDRLRYHFDNFMSRGTIALVAALFVATLCMIVTAALILLLFGIRQEGQTAGLGIAEAFWQVTVRTIDTGTVGGDTGWPFRIVAFIVTMGGIFITSALIGVLASGLEARLDDLRRGRSRVVEYGHTVILGWSPQVFTIINELSFANRNLTGKRRSDKTGQGMRRNPCIAILADRDKVEMEEEIRTKAPDTRGTHVVCRSGNPLDPDDLQIVNPQEARAIILLSPGGQYPDLPTAKSLMALRRNREQRERPYHIVTSVTRPVNLSLFRMIGGDEAQVFMVDRLISYLIAQTCRQSGLSSVYGELFSFNGAAIYFAEIPELTASTYGEALYRFENSSMIGLKYRDGRTQLNPAMDTIIQPGDQVIAIAGDDDAIKLSDKNNFVINMQVIQHNQTTPAPLDCLLILGWNRRAPIILDQVRQYAQPGSQALVCAPYPVEQMQSDCGGTDFQPLQVSFVQGNPTDRPNLEKLAGEGYSSIIILSPTDAADIQIADATTMISLLHLRDIAAKTGQKFSIVSEILDVRNRELTNVTSADDYIISEQMVALAMAQIAENKDVVPVFVDLISSGGTEIYLKPAGDYIFPGSQVDFYTAIAAAQQKGETAIGYRLLSEASQVEQSFGVHVNPDKSKLITFGENDQLIVVSAGS